MTTQAFETLLRNAGLGLSAAVIHRIGLFRELVLEENARQNLTRLLEPSDFLEGHVIDAVELLKSGLVSYPAADLGSGVGVPGLLCALIEPNRWYLVESEKSKAEFLQRAVNQLGLVDEVTVIPDRVESFLQTHEVSSVVSRAVGKVQKIFGWIGACSTWNTLVLLKGPGWNDEWADFQASGQRSKLKIEESHSYVVGNDHKKRVIVKLLRVPRGTTS